MSPTNVQTSQALSAIVNLENLIDDLSDQDHPGVREEIAQRARNNLATVRQFVAGKDDDVIAAPPGAPIVDVPRMEPPIVALCFKTPKITDAINPMLHCDRRAGHDGNHSWELVRAIDEATKRIQELNDVRAALETELRWWQEKQTPPP